MATVIQTYHGAHNNGISQNLNNNTNYNVIFTYVLWMRQNVLRSNIKPIERMFFFFFYKLYKISFYEIVSFILSTAGYCTISSVRPMKIKKEGVMENKAYLISISSDILKSQAEMICPCAYTYALPFCIYNICNISWWSRCVAIRTHNTRVLYYVLNWFIVTGKGGRLKIKETKTKIYLPEDRFPRWAIGWGGFLASTGCRPTSHL